MSATLSSGSGSSSGGRRGGGLRSVSLYSLLVIVTFVSIVPLWWMISTSLMTKPEIYVYPPLLWPSTPQWNNYIDAWTAEGMRFTLWTYNTLLITVVVLVGVMLTSSLCAYGFARIRFPGRNFWFVATLASVMLPSQVTLIPLYIIFFRIGWLDTLLPLTVPAWFGGGAINIFLIRQFFLSIPWNWRMQPASMAPVGCGSGGISSCPSHCPH